MRDWHQKVIELQQALALLPNFEAIRIGIMEGNIEFVETPIDNLGFSYDAANEGLNGTINNRKKTIRIRQAKPVNIFSGFDFKNLSPHATATAGVVSAKNRQDLPVKGIIENSYISNFSASQLVYWLINSGIEFRYYENNRIAQEIESISISGGYTFDENNEHTPPLSTCSIINGSITYPKVWWELSNNLQSNRRRQSVNHLYNTIKAYSRNGRGVLLVLGAGNKGNKDTTNIQFMSNYDYPLIIAASTITNDKIQTSIQEVRSSYSSKGNRIDMCGPSSGKYNQVNANKREIYTTTFIGGGQIGTDAEVQIKNITEQSNNNSLKLSDIDGIFPGCCVELGESGSINHEVLTISSVNKTDKIITFTSNRYYTATPFVINPAIVRIAVLKSEAKVGDLRNTITNLIDKKGFAFKDQQIYIYNDTLKHYAIVTNVSPDKSSITFNPAIPAIADISNIKVIPGQIIVKITSFYEDPVNEENTIIGIDTSIPDIRAVELLKSLFVGGLVDIYREGAVLASGVTIENINLNLREITLSKFELDALGAAGYIELRTIGYGSYRSSFGGTSAAAPVVSGVAGLVISANNNLNVLEVKHILKSTTDRIDGNYNEETNASRKNFGYFVSNNNLGTGRINAKKAVQLALDWHSSNPTQTVQKPIMQIADKLSGGYTGNIEQVALGQPIDSPDIWIKKLNDSNTSLPTVTAPFNNMSTDSDQKIFIRIRNTGSRRSFAECDIRVFLVFTDDEMPKFPFPEYWYDHDNVKIVDVKPIGFIEPGSSTIVTADWKNIKSDFELWNPADSEGKRKKTFILAHIAPFDGAASEVQLSDIRLNKQLTCKEIIVTHAGIRYGGIIIPGNSYNIPLENNTAVKTFALDINNIQSGDINSLVLKFIRKNRADASEEIITFSKTESIWSITGNQNPDWISFSQPVETPGSGTGYKNIVFPHTLSVNEDEENVRLEIVNT